MYKFLILSTLLLGLAALATNVLTGSRRSQQAPSDQRQNRTGAMLGAVRVPMAMVAARLGADVDSASGEKKKKASKNVDESQKSGKVRKTDEEWQAELTSEQYQVTRCSATERPFTGKYWNHKDDGTYMCVACGQDLFKSDTKFKSGSGWPSYFQPVSKAAVSELKDISLGMVRTEIVCSRCESHLGHVFEDGPRPTGLRYCINSAALDFRPKEQAKAEAEDGDR